MYGLMNKSIRLQCISLLKKLTCCSIRKVPIDARHNDPSHVSSLKKSIPDEIIKSKLNQKMVESREANQQHRLFQTQQKENKNMEKRRKSNAATANVLELTRKKLNYFKENQGIRSKSFPISIQVSKKFARNRSLKQTPINNDETVHKFNLNVWIKNQDDGGIYKGPDN
jgi:hypothetical protein